MIIFESINFFREKEIADLKSSLKETKSFARLLSNYTIIHFLLSTINIAVLNNFAYSHSIFAFPLRIKTNMTLFVF